ncbi:MAG: choice-of-anchor D domain-containing protein [Nitrospirales bacterium]|nr:choice-of-anchor D domain-containing protein [Nitrospirales bacterium]
MKKSIVTGLLLVVGILFPALHASAYTLTLLKTGTGGGDVAMLSSGGVELARCTPPCTMPQDPTTGNLITGVPDSNSNFGGWSGGGCSGTDSCSLVVTADLTITATFTAKPAQCTYSISPSRLSVSAAGSSNTVAVTSPGSCTDWTWSAVSDAAWLTIDSGATGSGNGTVALTVASSTELASRTGSVSIAGQTLTVTQAANDDRRISVSPASLDLGTVKTATSSQRSVTVTNEGSDALTISSMELSGADGADFTVLTGCATLPQGDSCAATVVFAPSAIGAKDATLTIHSDDPYYPAYTVALGGTASDGAAPSISVDTASISFPYANIEFGDSAYVVIGNTGTDSLVLSSVALQGRDAGEYTTNHDCSVVAAGSTCTVQVASSYTSNTPKEASLVISSNAESTPWVEVPVTAGALSCGESDIALSATSAAVPYEGTTGGISVTAASACWWRARSDNTWVSLTVGGEWSTGSGTMAYTVEANGNNAVVMGSLTIAGKQVSLVQYGSPDNILFSDTAGSAEASYINALAAKGITTGCGGGNFCPDDSVTREQVAAFIIRSLEGEPPSDYCAGGSPFDDVGADRWSCVYVKRLYERGVTTGCGAGDFCPETELSREIMAVLLVRALVGDDFTYTAEPSFSDVPESRWTFKYVQKLKDLGITVGCGNGNFCPDDILLRKYMAAFLGREFLGME